MKQAIDLNDVTIRTTLRPGDLGYVIYRHGKLYGDEHGFGVSFESYVAGGVHEFYKAYDPARDCVWIAEHNNNMVGFLLLMHRDDSVAQLRYFFLEADYRGIGLGRKMLSLYMEFLRSRRYQSSFLWTTQELQAAAFLYKSVGFKLTEERESDAFGRKLMEQRYELIISDGT